jgi:hypothetical protein
MCNKSKAYIGIIGDLWYIEKFVSQPSIETGKDFGCIFGWPKAIHSIIPRAEKTPLIAPI